MPTLPSPPFSHLAHQQEVRRCRGTACYGALVAHFGTESPKALEKLIDDQSPYCTPAGDLSIKNTYRRWRQGKLPSPKTVEAIRVRSKGAVELAYWRDLMLWELLEPGAPSKERLIQLLKQLPCYAEVAQGSGSSTYSQARGYLRAEQAIQIRNLYTFDAFLALLCYARKEELILDGDEEMHWICTRSAFDLFPHVLHDNPPLRYRWEALYVCIERIYWKYLYWHMPLAAPRLEIVKSNLLILDKATNESIRKLSPETI